MLAWLEMTALRREQGRVDEVVASAAANAERLPPDRKGARYWVSYLPLLYLEAGDREQAEKEYERFASERFESLERIWWWNAAMGYLAEGCVRLERRDVAPLLYDALLPHAATNIVHLTAYGCQGSTSHFLGMLAALLGRREEAEGHYEAALAMHAQLQSPNLTAKTRLEYAALLAPDPAERDRALDLVYEAHATFHELGMKYLEGRSHELRARLQASNAPAPASTAQPQVDGLTPREVEVLGLIASGLSNAGIAEQLVLSVATVERHISNIYGKIGARGRADATSYAIGHGLSAR
jgi:DNA-binding CsgD family transcriptional regulator